MKVAICTGEGGHMRVQGRPCAHAAIPTHVGFKCEMQDIMIFIYLFIKNTVVIGMLKSADQLLL
jgi:hypothetical protein